MIFMIFFQVKIYGFLFGFDSFITTDFFSTDKTGSGQRIVCFEHWLHSHRLVVSEVGFLFDLIWTLARTKWSGSAPLTWTRAPSSPRATGRHRLSVGWLAVTRSEPLGGTRKRIQGRAFVFFGVSPRRINGHHPAGQSQGAVTFGS
jgi:hypothetical protein